MTAPAVDLLAQCIPLVDETELGAARPTAGWLRDWAGELGFAVEESEVPGHGHNLRVHLDVGAGPHLVFNTHMDVVSAGPDWTRAPFEATPEEGRLYGRGSADAKGSLVAMMKAMAELAAAPEGASGRVTLTAVVAEELGGLGSLALVEDGLRADGAVVGEPTGLRVCRAHKGTYMRRLHFAGTAAHSASPWAGRNAIHDAAAFIAVADRANVDLPRHPVLGQGSLSVTLVDGGEKQNTIPSACSLLLDRRLTPGETHAGADLELQRLLDQVAAARPGIEVRHDVVVATVPSETAATADVVRVASAAAAAVGIDGTPSGFNAGCDMSKLVSVGVPTVVCGPGGLAQAHGPDEYVEVEQLELAVAMYRTLARQFLREEPDGGIAGS